MQQAEDQHQQDILEVRMEMQQIYKEALIAELEKLRVLEDLRILQQVILTECKKGVKLM